MISFEEKYDATLRKDPEYEGIFFLGVKTTGVFCRPTCNARKPKAQNVIFFNTTKQALQHGFRPCKVCKPLEPKDDIPVEIQEILKEINDQPFIKIKDYDLVKRGLEPSKVRRWFKRHHQLTFHAYQRMLRINLSYQKLNQGESVTHTAFDHGYESLSGFNDRFQSIFGSSPGKANGKQVINIVRFTTPLGPMYGCATEKGVCLVEFTDRRMLETEFKDLQKQLDAVILPGTNPHLDQLQKELGEYFDGKRKDFTLKLETPGTEFQQRAWMKLHDIPYGQTISYKAQAGKVGNPKAVRAVASANGHNRVAIIIPCHRVIGENNQLKGYGGGLARKKWLIDFERRNLASS